MRLRGLLPIALCLAAASALAAQSSPSPNASATVSSPSTPPARYPDGSGTPLGQGIHDLLSDPLVSRAHWGIAVTALDGTPLYGLDEGKLFRPASTAKLFTTAAAMALLGPETRFTTSVYGDLDTGTGIVHGDLTLLGGGDPSFGTQDLSPAPGFTSGQKPGQERDGASLADLAQKVVAAGVTQVTGDVLGNDTLFEAPTVPEGWAEEDLLWGYGALPSALSIGDNELRVSVRPKPPGPVEGQPADWIGSFATVDQIYPYLQVEDEVLTMPSDPEHTNGVDAEAIPGLPQHLRLYGRLSSTSPPATEHIALHDPAAYAAGALRTLLLGRGTRINGEAKAVHESRPAAATSFLHALRQPEPVSSVPGVPLGEAFVCGDTPHSSRLIAQHTSPPLREDVAFTLKTSANLHAEILLHHLGRRGPCQGATALTGARVVRRWLLAAGLADDDFLLFDGSGLSTKDLVTPRSEAQLLAYAHAQPWFAQWKAGLPIAGVDGTLSGRFTNSPLKGKAFAKTGTLGESRALAGFVQCASGHEAIFVILVDNHEPGGSADRTVMDKIVEAIAAND